MDNTNRLVFHKPWCLKAVNSECAEQLQRPHTERIARTQERRKLLQTMFGIRSPARRDDCSSKTMVLIPVAWSLLVRPAGGRKMRIPGSGRTRASSLYINLLVGCSDLRSRSFLFLILICKCCAHVFAKCPRFMEQEINGRIVGTKNFDYQSRFIVNIFYSDDKYHEANVGRSFMSVGVSLLSVCVCVHYVNHRIRSETVS